MPICLIAGQNDSKLRLVNLGLSRETNFNTIGLNDEFIAFFIISQIAAFDVSVCCLSYVKALQWNGAVVGNAVKSKVHILLYFISCLADRLTNPVNE